MAMKSDPKMKRLVVESDGEVPDVSAGPNEEDTDTSIETPYARDKAKGDDDDEAERDEKDAAQDDDSDEGDSDEDESDEGDGGEDEGENETASAAGSGGSEPPAVATKSVPAPQRPAAGDDLAPFLVPAYIAGLILLFVGERIVQSDDVLRYAFSGLGVAAVVASTALRLRTALAAAGERRTVERLLTLLMAGGVLAVAIYFTSTETGRNLLGIASMKPETRARVASATTVVWIALLVVSVVPLIFGEIALAPMRRAERIEVRRVRAATIGGATLAFAATYVALFAYAADELDLKLDFSYYRTSRPGESTKNIARSLNDPIEVIAFFPQLNDVGEEAKGYIQELAQASPQIQPRFEDRLLVPATAKELKVTQDGVLVLKRGENKESVVLGADMKTAQAKLKTLDADFQKALLKVMRSQRTAYFTVGHGEMNDQTGAAAAESRTAKNIKRLIESQNYLVKDLGLPQGLAAEVPQDAAMVLVLGPSQAMLPEEVASIKRYAERGGRLILALDPDGKVDLSPLAAAVGLTYKPVTLATDDARHFYPLRHNDSDHVILLTNRFSSHASISSLSKISQKTAIVLRGAAALDKADGAPQNIDFAVKTLNETFNDENGNFLFDKDTEKRNSYNVAAAITAPVQGEKDKDGKDKEMRVFAIGDADALSDAAVGDTPNGLMAVDVVRWLGGDESFLGAITSAEDVKIEHTKQKDTIWFYGTIFVVPLAVLGLGFIVTTRRRARRRAA